MRMERILITGANSFVGRNYIRFSNNRNVKEISLFDFKPEEINFSQVDIVIHLVAIVHQSKKIPENEYNKINRDLTVRIACCAKKAGVKQFIFLSTVKVYGDNNPGPWPLNESSECYPDDFYGKSKFGAELALRKLEDDDFIVSIIRTPLVYGDGVKANMLSFLKLIERFPVLPFGDVNNKRCYTFVENLVGYIDRIIEIRASGLFIAMDMASISTTELVTLISKYLRKRVKLLKLPDILLKFCHLLVPGKVDRLYGSFEMDNNKTLEILEYEPPFSTEEGIKRMVEAYKTNEIRKN